MRKGTGGRPEAGARRPIAGCSVAQLLAGSPPSPASSASRFANHASRSPAGSGRARDSKPCSSSQPRPSRMSRCAFRSRRPSATTLQAQGVGEFRTTASTTARASAVDSRSWTKLRSIFTCVRRQLAQVAEAGVAGAEVVDRQEHADAAPGPSKARCVASMSSMATVSVISHSSKDVRPSMLVARQGMRGPAVHEVDPGAAACTERLTATRMRRCLASSPRAHLAAGLVDGSSRPGRLMSPKRSASPNEDARRDRPAVLRVVSSAPAPRRRGSGEPFPRSILGW
jgi:hypothetical protein